MKKSSAVLILIFLIFFLFIFENLRTLFNQVEKSELNSIRETLKIKAKLTILENNSDLNLIKKSDYFEKVHFISKSIKDGMIEDGKGDMFIFFSMTTPGNNVLRFDKKIDFAVFKALKRIKSVISALTLLLGILVVITGIYLIVVARKKKNITSDVSVPLLQDYLAKLENAKSELNVEIEKQKIDVLRTDEINRSIINNFGAAIIYINNNGKIDIFNLEAEKMFGMKYVTAKNEEIKSALSKFKKIADFIEKNSSNPAATEINSGNRIFSIEVNPIKSGGRVIIIRDISEKRKRDSLKNQMKNFEQLGEMALFLTHEIRNSLGVIYGYTKTLKSESGKTAKINREIEFLKGMMESFLRFSKPLTIKNSESVSVSNLIKKIAGNYDLESEIIGEKKSVLRSDPDLLHSVFSNLIKNSRESGADLISVSFQKSGKNNLIIVFSDNGEGIKSEFSNKIWLPFYTSKEKGTGMGLPLVKKILNALNGEIILSKPEESGTTFTISFFDI